MNHVGHLIHTAISMVHCVNGLQCFSHVTVARHAQKLIAATIESEEEVNKYYTQCGYLSIPYEPCGCKCPIKFHIL